MQVTTAGKEAHEGEMGRILLFPSLRRRGGAKNPSKMETEVDDLRKYEATGEAEDYPRRMIINVIAFAFIAMLTLAGLWLAETLALLRKNQDCAFTSRYNCAEVVSRVHR
jgi:hypothetical protein